MRIGLLWALVLGACAYGAGCALDGATASKGYLDAGETAGGSSEDVMVRASMRRVPGAAAMPPAKAAGDVDANADALAPVPAPGPRAGDALTTAPADGREVIYSAAFRVVVADVPGSLAAIRQHAEKLGGYMQEVAGGAITVRVPAARFHDAVAFVERVGEVTDRQLRAQDVTEELRDLRTHIENHEKLRRRFQELLARAEKVEDVLKIEAELARVTEELDKAKGRLRYMESQIALSTIRVDLNAAVAQNAGGTGPRLPFAWVSELGAGLVEGQVQQTVRRSGIFGRGPRFKPPAGFVRYYENDGEIEAMSADGLRLRVQARGNVDKAPQSFWTTLVRKSLVEGRSLAVTDEQTGNDFYLVRGTREVGGRQLGYLLNLERDDRRVVVFEAWGPRELVDQQLDALRASALSVDP